MNDEITIEHVKVRTTGTKIHRAVRMDGMIIVRCRAHRGFATAKVVSDAAEVTCQRCGK